MVNTGVFHIGNDYELYECAEQYDFGFLKTYFHIEDDSKCKEIIELWLSDRQE